MAKMLKVEKSPFCKLVEVITWDDITEEKKIACRDKPVNRPIIKYTSKFKDLNEWNES